MWGSTEAPRPATSTCEGRRPGPRPRHGSTVAEGGPGEADGGTAETAL